MERLKSTLPNMLLSLTLISAIAGAILAGVYMLTEQPIAASKAATLQNAIRAVVPEFDNQPIEEAFMAATSEGDSLKIYPAKMGGQLVGAAVESNTQKGFSGEIKVIVGFDAERSVGLLFNDRHFLAEVEHRTEMVVLLQEVFGELVRGADRHGRNVVDGLCGIEFHALTADSFE